MWFKTILYSEMCLKDYVVDTTTHIYWISPRCKAVSKIIQFKSLSFWYGGGDFFPYSVTRMKQSGVGKDTRFVITLTSNSGYITYDLPACFLRKSGEDNGWHINFQ